MSGLHRVLVEIHGEEGGFWALGVGRWALEQGHPPGLGHGTPQLLCWTLVYAGTPLDRRCTRGCPDGVGQSRGVEGGEVDN